MLEFLGPPGTGHAGSLSHRHGSLACPHVLLLLLLAQLAWLARLAMTRWLAVDMLRGVKKQLKSSQSQFLLER